MVKAMIEERTNRSGAYKNLGGEFLTQKATVKGDLDFFLTFTGTQFLGTFQQKVTPGGAIRIKSGNTFTITC